MSNIFGTDGVRGIAGSGNMHPAFLYKLGLASLKHFPKNVSNKVLIGRDTRISSDMVFSSLVSGMLLHGYDILDLGVVTTPALSYLTQHLDVCGGVMISASHNPYNYNGIKFFDNNGFKFTDSVESDIEKDLGNIDLSQVLSSNIQGKIYYSPKLIQHYIDYIIQQLPAGLLNNKHILYDGAHGSGYDISINILEALGARVTKLGCEPNGININDNVGSINISSLKKRSGDIDYDMAFALDGDGDRVMILDNLGRVYNGDKVLAILSLLLKEDSVIVGTIMSNQGLVDYLESRGMKFIRASVGDKHVHKQMQLHDSYLGGESSGHIITNKDLGCGDGLLTFLNVMKVFHQVSLDINDAYSLYNSYPNCEINVPLPSKEEDIATLQNEINKYISGLSNIRSLVRLSGTEPILRVLIEGADGHLINTYQKEMKNLIDNMINSFYTS